MIVFKMIVVTLFGQNKSYETLFSRVNCYSDKELPQEIGGKKFDSMCYQKNYDQIGGRKLEPPPLC